MSVLLAAPTPPGVQSTTKSSFSNNSSAVPATSIPASSNSASRSGTLMYKSYPF